MSSKIKQIFLFVLGLVFAFTITKNAFAFQTSSADGQSGNLSLSASQNINDNYFAFGNLVTLDGNVIGDLFTAGNQVDINGQFGNNIFAAANTMLIKGKISRDVFAAGATVTIDKDAVIDGDVSVAANAIVVNGEIKGTLRAAANTLAINGKVGKAVKANVSDLTINSGAIITGDVTYTSSNQAKIDPSATVSGQVEMKQPSSESEVQSNTAKISSFLLSLLSILLVGVVLLLIMPKKAQDLANLIKTRFWASLGVGFLTLIAVPVAIIILLAIFIGIPIALILLALYIFAIYIGKIFVGLAIGKLISKDEWSPIWAMTLGVIIISIICLVPYLGGLVGFVAMLLGLGSISFLLFTKK